MLHRCTEPRQKARLIFCLSLVLSAVSLRSKANDENAVGFSALCEAYNAATGTITAERYTGNSAAPTIPSDVTHLFVATADDELFANKTYWEYSASEEDWTKAKTELTNHKDEKGNQKIKRPEQSALKKEVHKQLGDIRKQAQSAAENLRKATADIEGHLSLARKVLAQAAVGDDVLRDAKKTDFAAHAMMCAGGGTHGPGKTITADLVCLCSGATDGANICGTGIGSTRYTNEADDAANALQAWGDIKDHCKRSSEDTETTVNTITSALANFQSALGKGVNAGPNAHNKLGNGAAGSCTGTASATTCIDYTAKLNKNPIGKLEWVGKLLTARNELEQATVGKREVEAAKAALQATNTSAWQVYNFLTLSKVAAISAAATNKPPTGTGAPQEKEAKESCNKLQSKDKCTDPCKWEEKATDTNKKCSLDSVKAAEQQTSQAGGGTETTTDKCGAAKTPEECAVVKGDIPKDKKAVCGWIKGKCQDSSILVTKKFALSAAAFVALLF
uniref:Variant surface glycoprotein 1125.4163 n=1 Tax=Trypanosoma brucei TaxID=5691 RepID=M4TDB0_9TRYP|nr:variant surface glycoprotein 464 [Trypanosoma brucei]APD74694.1 variant surface glycoprotein 1125.4163 [Trypanosoma brucei]